MDSIIYNTMGSALPRASCSAVATTAVHQHHHHFLGNLDPGPQAGQTRVPMHRYHAISRNIAMCSVFSYKKDPQKNEGN